ncbi:hypothetical protein C4F49_02545 [Sphingobacterium sp. KB22]|uniref:Uncharacterized protein n=1 Tax=Sphingobacterium hungaricum TaxID=2082723 RepID=A0A928YQ31_9SPHI|nr:hypothetical protein [Sphingobacterium hungaricum]
MKNFDIPLSIKSQKEFCDKTNSPHFAPLDGKCYACKSQIYEEKKQGSFFTGVSVDKASTQLITGCPHCYRSYCD